MLGCNFNSSNSNCNGGGFYSVLANSYGGVGVTGISSEYCYVGLDGNSRCS